MKYILIIVAISILSCTPKVEKDFKSIPIQFDTLENIIKAITPSKKYIYWECIFKEYLDKPSRTIINRGDSSKIKHLKYHVPLQGFITKNWIGYYYIAYYDENVLKYAYDTKSLQEFIGRINNLAEALLIAETQNLSVDLKRKVGSSYKQTKNGFELHLAKFHLCPMQSEAFKVSVDTLGNLNARSLNYFYNINENICAD